MSVLNAWNAQLSCVAMLSASSLLPKEKNAFAVPRGPELVLKSPCDTPEPFLTDFLTTFFTCAVHSAP